MHLIKHYKFFNSELFFKRFLIRLLLELFQSCKDNLRQKSLRQMRFLLQNTFFAWKLSFSSPKTPSPHFNVDLIAEDIVVNSSAAFLSSSNIALGEGGSLTRNFVLEAKCLNTFV